MQFWDPATGKKDASSPYATRRAPIRYLGAVAPGWRTTWRPETEKAPMVVREWENGQGAGRMRKADKVRVRCLAFSPDGKTLAIGGSKDIRLWDWKGNRKDRQLGDFSGRVWCGSGFRRTAGGSRPPCIRKACASGTRTKFEEKYGDSPGNTTFAFFPTAKRVVTLTPPGWCATWFGKGGWANLRTAPIAQVSLLRGRQRGHGIRPGARRFWDPETGKDHSPPVPSGLSDHDPPDRFPPRRQRSGVRFARRRRPRLGCGNRQGCENASPRDRVAPPEAPPILHASRP